MFKKLYLAFGLGVILLYAASTLMGWEFFNGGSRSYFRSPFIWIGGGFRGGK
jgi:high-affinity Fe2+/Pb2+ permease